MLVHAYIDGDGDDGRGVSAPERHAHGERRADDRGDHGRGVARRHRRRRRRLVLDRRRHRAQRDLERSSRRRSRTPTTASSRRAATYGSAPTRTRTSTRSRPPRRSRSPSAAIAGSISGAGAFALNVILTSTKAHVDSEHGQEPAARSSSPPTTNSSIDALILAASVAVAGGAFGGAGSIGAAIARNLIGWATLTATTATPAEVKAYVLGSSVIAGGDLQVTAHSSQTINATVIAGSVALSAGLLAIGLSGAGRASSTGSPRT